MISENIAVMVAAAPILAALVLLLLRVSSLWAAVGGLAVAVAGSLYAFPVDSATVWASATRLGPTVLTVAFILLGGVGLAEATTRTGARDVIAGWLSAVDPGPDRSLTLLLLIFGVTPFMESVTGFGLGVAITAPLLISMGLPPVKAVITGLLGVLLSPWGSLAPGLLVSAELGGVDFADLGVWTAVLNLPVILAAIATVLVIIVGRPTLPQVLLAGLIAGILWVTLIAANLALGPPLAGVFASFAVIVALLLIARIRYGRLPATTRRLGRALLPYGVLVGGILGASLVLALTGTDRLGWAANPALWLLIAALIALAPLRRQRGEFAGALRSSTVRWVPIAANAIAFILIGIVMATTGMAAHLATWAAGIGPVFTGLVPLIGALGGYLTGSNTGAAAMFSAATTTATANLGANPLLALAGQNVAASFAFIASPPRIALAAGVALPAGTRVPPVVGRTLGVAILSATAVLGVVLLIVA